MRVNMSAFPVVLGPPPPFGVTVTNRGDPIASEPITRCAARDAGRPAEKVSVQGREGFSTGPGTLQYRMVVIVPTRRKPTAS